jgi:hypothetical protein
MLLTSQGLRAADGSAGDPYALTVSDTSLNDGYYYEAASSVDYGGGTIYIGNTSANNFLTITGSGVTVHDDIAYIGYAAGSVGTVTVTDGSS